MNIRSAAAFTIGIAALGVALTGCQSAGSPTATTPAAPVTEEPTTPSEETTTPAVTPSPTETTPALSLPTACDQLGTAATRDAVIGTLGEQPTPKPAPGTIPDASLTLGCSWFAGDVTGLTVLIAQPATADAETAVAALAADGYTCDDAAGYTQCTREKEGDYNGNKYPTKDHVIVRDGVWLQTDASNVDATALTDEIVSSIWG